MQTTIVQNSRSLYRNLIENEDVILQTVGGGLLGYGLNQYTDALSLISIANICGLALFASGRAVAEKKLTLAQKQAENEIKEYAEYKKSKYSYTKSNKPVILIISSTYDFNGALKISQKKQFEELEKNGYDIVFREASSLNEVLDEVKSIGCKINILFINIHGSPQSLGTSETSKIVYSVSENYDENLIDTLKSVGANLKKKGTIILQACSSGKESEGQPCIARRIQEITQRRVIAPVASVDPRWLTFRDGTIGWEAKRSQFLDSFITPTTPFLKKNLMKLSNLALNTFCYLRGNGDPILNFTTSYLPQKTS